MGDTIFEKLVLNEDMNFKGMNLTRGIVLDCSQFKTIFPHDLFKYRYS